MVRQGGFSWITRDSGPANTAFPRSGTILPTRPVPPRAALLALVRPLQHEVDGGGFAAPVEVVGQVTESGERPSQRGVPGVPAATPPARAR